MKIQLPGLIAGLLSLALFTAMKPSEKNNYCVPAIRHSDWGQWRNVSCYKGIDFRTKRGDYNSYARKWNWYVQFRNRYYEKINFNYIISEPDETENPDHRTHIEAEDTGDSKLALLSSSGGCHVTVGMVRFGENDTGTYSRCDQ